MAFLATYRCGDVPGIEKEVDLNVFNGTFEELQSLLVR